MVASSVLTVFEVVVNNFDCNIFYSIHEPWISLMREQGFRFIRVFVCIRDSRLLLAFFEVKKI